MKSIIEAIESKKGEVKYLQKRDALSEKRDTIINKIHDETYLNSLTKTTENCATTNKPQRLRQSYSRTLVDKYSSSAALSAASAWMHCVSTSTKTSPSFAIVRPPSHHATKQRGMGGCLINSVATAAFYAMEKYENVGIIDFDAHHGNGIANCVEDERRIR